MLVLKAHVQIIVVCGIEQKGNRSCRGRKSKLDSHLISKLRIFKSGSFSRKEISISDAKLV